MIDKEQAIKKIHDIENNGLNSVGVLKDISVVELWSDVVFRYGIDYGAIIMLMRIFDIRKEEL